MEQKIKWILFDVGGVVVHLTFTNPEGYTIGSRHFAQKDLEGFYFTKQFNSYMLAQKSHEQFMTWYFKSKKLDIDVEEFNTLLQEDIRPMEGIVELMQKLSTKYKIGLATNDGGLISKYKIEKSEALPFLSKIIASYRIRELKPHASFYKKMLSAINARPEECIFIDDTKANVEAAQALGIKSILFIDPQQLESELIK